MEGKRAACPFWQLSIGLGGYLSAALSRYSFEGCVCNTDWGNRIRRYFCDLASVNTAWYVYASASPRLRQALRASSSGVSWQITLSQARFAPFSRQLSSQVRIHSPSPQP